mgnify:CR=1 FL=1
MSHVKNADAYSRLVGICTGYGGKYNPGRQTLQLKAMRALLEEAQSSLQHVKQTETDYNKATNQRELTFMEIQNLAPLVLDMLKSTGVPAQTIKDAYHFFRLVKGRRATPRPPISADEAEAAPKRIRSYTHQSYVSIADNFARLVQTVEAEPLYRPNEAKLQVPALRQLISEALTANGRVLNAKVAWAKARAKRDEILYKAEHAVYVTAKAAKHYVRAAFGKKSNEYQQLAGLSFTKPSL